LRKKYVLFFSLLSFFVLLSRPAFADIEWSEKKHLDLETAPIDVVPSLDGKWLYVLTSGEIHIYSLPEYRVVKRIPLGKSFDRLAYSPEQNTLIASSSAEKTVKIIQLDVVHRFSYEGLPFKGPENAPVTIAVFSDYQ
jgi:hypothetical protein